MVAYYLRKNSVLKSKMQLRKKMVQNGDTSMFQNLTMLLQSNANMKCNFTQRIISDLNPIVTAIKHCIPGIGWKVHTDINHKHYIENNLVCIANNVPNPI